MKKRYHLFFYFIVLNALILTFASAVLGAVTIENAAVVDVTPSGFSVIWQTSEPAVSRISIFSDAQGSLDITRDFETVAFPVHSGDPAIEDEYASDLSKKQIQDQSRALGMVKVSVFGCAPDTAYYFTVHSQAGGETAAWPELDPGEVMTAKENAFASDARQLKVTLTNNSKNLAGTGWIISAATAGMRAPVSEFVGDGAGPNQACLNLSNFFDMDGNNKVPSELSTIDIEIRVPGSDPVQGSASINFSENFIVTDLVSITLNMDGDESPPLFGDIDQDLDIDGQDLALLISLFGMTKDDAGFNVLADFNADGIVDETDLTAFARVFFLLPGDMPVVPLIFQSKTENQ